MGFVESRYGQIQIEKGESCANLFPSQPQDLKLVI
jgi:hypothetical protein